MNGKPILETARCIVREFAMDDLDALFRLYEPPEITRFVEPLYDREKEAAYQENYIHVIYGGLGFGMWLVVDKATGEVIGRVGLEQRPEDSPDTVELGYVIAAGRQRQGLATEVCTAILSYAKNVLHKRFVYARVHPDNVGSNRLLERLGFVATDEMVEGERVWRYELAIPHTLTEPPAQEKTPVPSSLMVMDDD